MTRLHHRPQAGVKWTSRRFVCCDLCGSFSVPCFKICPKYYGMGPKSLNCFRQILKLPKLEGFGGWKVCRGVTCFSFLYVLGKPFVQQSFWSFLSSSGFYWRNKRKMQKRFEINAFDKRVWRNRCKHKTASESTILNDIFAYTRSKENKRWWNLLRYWATPFRIRHLISPVGKASVCCAGGSGSIPGRTNTQGLKITEEKVLPLL